MIIKNIPIYIISFNRLACLEKQIEFFEKHSLKNIHIIDNGSSYPPLLDYLQKTPYQVHKMDGNHKHMVLFEAEQFQEIVDNEYFILTDPDIIPIDECPDDFLEVFMDILDNNPKIKKVGFSLKINDLPDHYQFKKQVIGWESAFFKHGTTYKNIPIYDAQIDTTFAVYRPRKKWKSKKDFFTAIRTGSPYEARHLPWYSDCSKPTDEDIFYNNLDSNTGNWNGKLSAEELSETHSPEPNYSLIFKVFFIIPILRIRIRKGVKTFYLFSFIPFLKMKKNEI